MQQRPLAPEQVDAAIAEMNAEMHELFGSVGADVQVSPPVAQAVDITRLTVRDSTSQPPEWFTDTKAALQNHLHRCGGELAKIGTSDHETRQGERLAATIAECARALAALHEVRPGRFTA